MSSSIQPIRFLLDENVRIELAKFLRSRKLDFRLAAKGAPDRTLARLSKSQKRIFVTNDIDFAAMPASQIFSVVLLRLPQNDSSFLLSSFEALLTECKNFRGRLIIVEITGWSSVPLSVEIKI